MRRRALLRLYPQRWRERYEEEIGELVDSRPLTVGAVVDLLRGAFDAHAHPELVEPSLVGSTGSGQVPLTPRQPASPVAVVVRVVLAFLLLNVLGLGLLYAYRAQTPTVPSVAVSEAIGDIQAGRVRAVTIEGNRAKLVLTDGRTEETVVGGDVIVRAVAARNQAGPAQIDLRVNETSPVLGISSSILLSLLPVFVLLALVLLGWVAFTRSRRPQRYQLLARLGDLRDRGVITQEEFEREKRRVLR
jgi:hypothetical protein